MKLKIESAEDLIRQSAPGHTVCRPAKSINWVTNEGGIVIVCGCELEMTLTFNYLIEELGVNALEDVKRFVTEYMDRRTLFMKAKPKAAKKKRKK